MKIRSGFVSNSSSSSYVLVGIREYGNESVFQKIMRALKFPQVDDYEDDNDFYMALDRMNSVDYGQYRVGDLIIIAGEEGPTRVGLDVISRFKKDQTFTSTKEELVKTLSDLGVDINIDKIDLEYGESYSG